VSVGSRAVQDDDGLLLKLVERVRLGRINR